MIERSRGKDRVGCALVSDVLRSFGRVRIRVRGSSMLPCVLPGDILAVQRQQLHDVAPGDIVLFTHENRLFAHRVVERITPGALTRGAACLVTCGDSVPENDPPVFARQLLGRVTFIIRRDRRISPAATFSARWVSILLRRSRLLTRSLLWILNRNLSRGEKAACRA